MLNPSLTDGHTSLALLRYYHKWDWRGSEEAFKRALELDPNNVNAHQFYGRLLATVGRYDEAIAEIQIARELDPRSADLAVPLFAVLEKQGRYEEALKALEVSLEMDKGSLIARRAVGKIYLLKADYPRVIQLADELFGNSKEIDLFWVSMLATAHHRLGHEDKATEMQRRLAKLATTDPKALYFLAMHLSELGNKDEAIAALQKCLELREERMVWTKDEPRFFAIRDDSRFQDILQKLNLAG
jgi:tetratricopeptide (TPR) repeat protein